MKLIPSATYEIFALTLDYQSARNKITQYWHKSHNNHSFPQIMIFGGKIVGLWWQEKYWMGNILSFVPCLLEKVIIFGGVIWKPNQEKSPNCDKTIFLWK